MDAFERRFLAWVWGLVTLAILNTWLLGTTQLLQVVTLSLVAAILGLKLDAQPSRLRLIEALLVSIVGFVVFAFVNMLSTVSLLFVLRNIASVASLTFFLPYVPGFLVLLLALVGWFRVIAADDRPLPLIGELSQGLAQRLRQPTSELSQS